MRNQYAGKCYRCGGRVAAGEGHFERHQGSWRTQHAFCAIQARQAKMRSTPPTETIAERENEG